MKNKMKLDKSRNKEGSRKRLQDETEGDIVNGNGMGMEQDVWNGNGNLLGMGMDQEIWNGN